jgi:ATP synthase protein I
LHCDDRSTATCVIGNKTSQINEVDGYAEILTCLDAVSMVRAAFEGDGGVISIDRNIVPGVHNMAGGTNDSGNENGDKSSSDEAALSARLGSLDHRLSEIRDSRKVRTDQPESGSGDGAARASAMARGLRLSSELIAGVVVGALIGWGIDRLLSISPWGLIVFVLLGFAAGVVNVIRSAGVAPDRTGR